jgi:hypothetical protein
VRQGWHIAVLHVLAEIALSPPLISRHARARTHTHTHTHRPGNGGESAIQGSAEETCAVVASKGGFPQVAAPQALVACSLPTCAQLARIRGRGAPLCT